MARTKQSLRRRAKSHVTRALRVRKRKNLLKGARRRSRNRPHRRVPSAKK